MWGEWDSVTCYACGLLSIDPEVDQPGTYSINPGEGKKMYNHSCDLMDNGVNNNNVFRGGQDLDPKSNYDVVWETKEVQICKTENGTETLVDNHHQHPFVTVKCLIVVVGLRWRRSVLRSQFLQRSQLLEPPHLL